MAAAALHRRGHPPGAATGAGRTHLSPVKAWLLSLPVAAAIVLLVSVIGPPLIKAAIPFLALLPPGFVLMAVTGFVTTAPVQMLGSVAGLGLGRVGVRPAVAVCATVLAAAVGVMWEVSAISLHTVLSTGPDLLIGRSIGFLAAAFGAAAACRAGRRRIPVVSLARQRV